uniref:Uncharacterized protein n=1 Tax=Romanomermis culicivorax TaxID=13658 RepID=A0A915JWI5_ROMCU
MNRAAFDRTSNKQYGKRPTVTSNQSARNENLLSVDCIPFRYVRKAQYKLPLILAMYTCLFRRNGMECNRRNVTERKGNFRSVRLEVTVGRFRKIAVKLLTIRSVGKGKYK